MERVSEARIQEIVARVAVSQMRDSVQNQELAELISEAWMGVLEARGRLEARGQAMNEGLIWRVAKFQILRWKLKMRSPLSIPEGSAAKEAKAGRLKVGREMKDYVEEASPAEAREQDTKKILRMLREKVEERLDWVERKVMASLIEGGNISDVWKELEEMGLANAKALAFGAKAKIRDEWRRLIETNK